MQVDLAVLAHGYNWSDTGRLCIEEIIGSMRVPRLGNLTGMKYVAMLSLEPQECDKVYNVSLQCIDPDGRVCGTTTTEEAMPKVNPFDAHCYLQLVFEFSCNIVSPGVYFVRMMLDDKPLHSTRFEIHVGPLPSS